MTRIDMLVGMGLGLVTLLALLLHWLWRQRWRRLTPSGLNATSRALVTSDAKTVTVNPAATISGAGTAGAGACRGGAAVWPAAVTTNTSHAQQPTNPPLGSSS